MEGTELALALLHAIIRGYGVKKAPETDDTYVNNCVSVVSAGVSVVTDN